MTDIRKNDVYQRDERKDTDVCNGDGWCDVYQQTDRNEYRRRRGTEWCTCSASMCILPCPNVLLCGTQAPKWFFDCHSGRCVYCNMFIGVDLTFVTGTGDACPVCMEPTVDTLIEWPTCPGKHAFCIPCTHKMHFSTPYTAPEKVSIEAERTAQESDEENAKDEAEAADDDDDDDEDDEEKWSNTKDCPLCRHVNILHWKKRKV
jgi:hypothetical protein